MTKPKNYREKFITLLDNILEHKLFKPITTSVIITFVIFNIVNYASTSFQYQDNSSQKQYQQDTITINIENQKISEGNKMQHRVKSGDTLLQVLVRAGIEESEISQILASVRKEFNPGSINVGHSIILDYSIKLEYDSLHGKNTDKLVRRAIVDKVRIVFSPEIELVVTKDKAGNYQTKEIKHELVRRVLKYSGSIQNSLFVDGVALGASPTTMMNMINLYSYDVDFQRDLQKDNKFEILVESFYTKDGQKVRDGAILFSSLSLSNRKIELYAHKVRGGQTEYFNAKGESIRKSLLRTPVNGARISSGFGMRRHPVLGYSKLHKGIDFAAPTGTPIFAAGDGVIIYRGRFGGYGNYIKIKHNAEFSTAYAHASRFSKNFRVGSKVKQGNVIAYVGTTGRSTGPHLHYEILKRGAHINPRTVKTTSGVRLGGKSLEEFRRAKASIDELLRTTKVNIRN